MGVLKTTVKNNLQTQIQSIRLIQPGPADFALRRFLSEFPHFLERTDEVWAVAYSGGADSTALLAAAIRYKPGKICAFHIHHGLQEAADDFLKHCRQQCISWGIAFYEKHVDARHIPGESPEDAARNSRYKALAAMSLELGIHRILLAQHADDQIETLLLALSRGAGLPGLASMPAVFERHHMQFIRPLLTAGAAELRQWLNENDIDWIDDPTNADKCYTRNRIRLDILPAIAQAFAQYRQTFIRSIKHVVQAQEILEEVAIEDLQITGQPPVIKQLQSLSVPRQTNVLRYWLKHTYQTAPSTKQMDELRNQIQACRTRGHHIDLKIGHGRLYRSGDVLQFKYVGMLSSQDQVF